MCHVCVHVDMCVAHWLSEHSTAHLGVHVATGLRLLACYTQPQ